MLFFGTKSTFRFFEPGPLIDAELELIEPDPRYFDELLASSQHEQTARDSPREASATRQRLTDFVRIAPRGRNKGDGNGKVPSYHFWMRTRDTFPSPLRIVGAIDLRVGDTHNIHMYGGHIGYHVFPAARGNHFAERAVRLLLPLARRHGLSPIWITCNPDNYPSRRTCERLGATLVETVRIPETHELYLGGEREKCRYRIQP